MPDLRWAETAAEVPDATVVEPSSGVKDVGWAYTGYPNLEWFQWLAWGAAVTFRHIARSWNLLWQREMVMPGAASSEGVVTAGTGLSVDVTEAGVWISGGWYTVPAANDLALSAAHATLARVDLVYAHLNSGVPEYAVETGTPGASPSAPATPASGVKIAEVAVAATAVVPGTITDVREFGVVEVDTVEANDRFGAGWDGSRWLLRVFSSNLMWIGTSVLDPLLYVTMTGTPSISVKPSAFLLFTSITRRLVLGPTDFTRMVDGLSGGGPYPAEIDGYLALDSYFRYPSSGAGSLWSILSVTLKLPKGVTITAVRVWLNRADNTNGVAASLVKVDKTDGTSSTVGTADTGTGSGPVGNISAEATGLGEIVDLDYRYHVLVAFTRAHASNIDVYSVEVEYSESSPYLTD